MHNKKPAVDNDQSGCVGFFLYIFNNDLNLIGLCWLRAANTTSPAGIIFS